MNTKEYEINLLKETLDTAMSQESFQPYLSYYTEYYSKASVHTPITSEDWGKTNRREGPASIRSTTCKLLTAMMLVKEGYEIKPVTNKKELSYGSDLKASKGALDYTFSINPTKPRVVPDDIELKLLREYFAGAEWRVTFLSLVHPEGKQLWLINYPLVGNMFCTKSDRGLYTPTFATPSIPLKVQELKKIFPRGIQHIELQDNI